MIKVHVAIEADVTSIVITGHAQDRTCAAVSALSGALINALVMLGQKYPKDIHVHYENGSGKCVTYTELATEASSKAPREKMESGTQTGTWVLNSERKASATTIPSDQGTYHPV